MIVVSDTTAVTNLISIGRVGLLQELFGTVLVPEAVLCELKRHHAELPDFLLTTAVQDRAAVRALVPPLHDGEAEAIILAAEQRADRLLIDETTGRAIARERGLPVIGLIGVLRLAKEKGLIPHMGPVLQELEGRSRFWISPRIRDQALRDAGETSE